MLRAFSISDATAVVLPAYGLPHEHLALCLGVERHRSDHGRRHQDQLWPESWPSLPLWGSACSVASSLYRHHWRHPALESHAAWNVLPLSISGLVVSAAWNASRSVLPPQSHSCSPSHTTYNTNMSNTWLKNTSFTDTLMPLRVKSIPCQGQCN